MDTDSLGSDRRYETNHLPRHVVMGRILRNNVLRWWWYQPPQDKLHWNSHFFFVLYITVDKLPLCWISSVQPRLTPKSGHSCHCYCKVRVYCLLGSLAATTLPCSKKTISDFWSYTAYKKEKVPLTSHSTTEHENHSKHSNMSWLNSNNNLSSLALLSELIARGGKAQ